MLLIASRNPSGDGRFSFYSRISKVRVDDDGIFCEETYRAIEILRFDARERADDESV
jgi:hypothetical protein